MLLLKIENTLLFLTVLLLPTQLGKHLWPDFSFVYSIKVDYLSPTIYVWDLLVILLILVFLIQGKQINESQGVRLLPCNKLALNIGLFFILAQALSLIPFLFSPYLINIGTGLVRIEQFLVVVLFGVYLASQNFKQLLPKLFWPLSISLIFVSVLGALQFLFNHSIGFWILGERTFSISTPAIAKFDYQSFQFLRPYSTFSHPNVLAAFVLIVLPILKLQAQTQMNYPAAELRGIRDAESSSVNHSSPQQAAEYSGSRIEKKVFYVSLAVGSLVTVLTVARTALVAGVVALGFNLNRKFFFGLVGILLVLSPLLYTRFASIKDFDSLSLTRREQMNQIALNLFVENPVFGVGVNNFIPTAADQLLIGPNRFLQPVHNMYLLTLAETGLVGFMALALIFLSALIVIYKSNTSMTTKNTLYMVWLIIAFLGLFDHYWLTAPQGYRLLFLVWGISLSLSNVIPNSFRDLPISEDAETSSA